MRLQPEEPVDHLRAALLQRARPLDVAGLVEAGLELDDRRHLLAALRRAGEGLDDGRVPAGAVERLLDREDVRVVGGAGDELDHRIERVVRVVDEDVAFPDHGEEVVRVAERRGGLRREGLVAQLAPLVVGDGGDEVGDVERPLHPVDVALRVDVQGLGEALDARVHPLARVDLDAHRVAAVAAAQLGLDGLEQVLPLLLVDLEVPVARHAEGVGAAQPRGREELLHVAGDHVLDEHEGARRAVDPHAEEAAEHRGHLEHAEAGLLPLVLAGEHDAEVDALVAEVGERVPRVDRERRQHREDVGAEALVEEGEIGGRQLLRPDDDDACAPERGHELGVPEPVGAVDERVDALADGLELLERGEPVGRNLDDGALRLRLQAGDAHHEELVEVREEDAQELEALEERHLGRARLGEDARVELEPRELAVQVVRRVVVEDEGGRRGSSGPPAPRPEPAGSPRWARRGRWARQVPGCGRRPVQGRRGTWSSGAAAGRPRPRWELARWTRPRMLAHTDVMSFQTSCSRRPPAPSSPDA